MSQKANTSVQIIQLNCKYITLVYSFDVYYFCNKYYF